MASPSVHISRATALCVQCGKAVTPPADGTVRFGIEVDGKFYHKDCFKCSNCQHSLVGQVRIPSIVLTHFSAIWLSR